MAKRRGKRMPSSSMLKCSRKGQLCVPPCHVKRRGVPADQPTDAAETRPAANSENEDWTPMGEVSWKGANKSRGSPGGRGQRVFAASSSSSRLRTTGQAPRFSVLDHTRRKVLAESRVIEFAAWVRKSLARGI